MIDQRKRRFSEQSDDSITSTDTDSSDYIDEEPPALKRRRTDELFEELRLWREAQEKFRIEFMDLMRSYNKKVDKLAEMMLKYKTKLDLCDK